jgi:hypothetical protein
MHKPVLRYSHNLRTSSPDYDPLQKLHSAIIEAIRAITRDEVPWAKTPPYYMTVASPWRRGSDE